MKDTHIYTSYAPLLFTLHRSIAVHLLGIEYDLQPRVVALVYTGVDPCTRGSRSELLTPVDSQTP